MFEQLKTVRLFRKLRLIIAKFLPGFSLSKKARKVFALSAKTALAFFIFINLIFGFDYWKWIFKTIKAFESPTQSVNFYAGHCQVDQVPDNYSQGWWQAENVEGIPSLPFDAKLIDFNDTNSAFYSDGSYSLLCNSFKSADEDSLIENYLKQNGGIPSLDEEVIASTSTSLIPDINDAGAVASSSNEILPAENANPVVNTENIISSSSVEILSSEPPQEVIIGSSTEFEITPIENIIQSSSTAGSESVNSEEVSTSTENSLISRLFSPVKNLIAKIKNNFSSQSALAEQVAVSNNPLNDIYGQFKGATIKLSMAAQVTLLDGSLAMPVENQLENIIPATSSIETIPSLIEASSTLEEILIIESQDNIIIEDNLNPEESSVEIINEILPIEIIADPANMQTSSGQINLSLQETIQKYLALQAVNATGEGKILISYSFETEPATSTEDDGMGWKEAEELTFDQFSNFDNNGYWSKDVDFINNWDDLRDLSLKLEGIVNGRVQFVSYLDSVFVEAHFEPVENIIEKHKRWKSMLAMLSEQDSFMLDENWEMKFHYNKNNTTLGDWLNLANYWRDINLNAEIYSNNELVKIPLTIIFGSDGDFTIKLQDVPNTLKPGMYQIKFTIEDGSSGQAEIIEITKDFSWGVLAINTNKSIYAPLENAYLQFGVLDDTGHTICDAELEMAVMAPDGATTTLSTKDGTITKNSACGPNNVILVPDYFAHYQTGLAGIYSMKLTAKTLNGSKTVVDQFEVRDNVQFDVERVGPTRIYPWADYDMNINIKAKVDFAGSLVEYIPNGFSVVSQNVEIKSTTTGEFVDYASSTGENIIFEVENTEAQKIPKWQNIKLKAGDEIRVRYSFDAPNVSPEFYLLGALELRNNDNEDNIIFKEARRWQIAGDTNVDILSAQTIGITAGTTDTTNWTTIVSIPSTSFVGGNKYLIYIAVGFAGSTATVSADYQITYNTTSQLTGWIEPASATAYDAAQVSWFDVYDQPSTPTSVSLEYRTNAGTSYALNAQIMVIDLSDIEAADYKYGTNNTSAQLNTTLTSKASITLDQADSVKDWLVIAMEEVLVDSATVNYEGQIFDGTTGYMYYSREGENISEILSYAIYRPFDNVPLNTTYSIQVRDDQTGVNDHLKSRIFAINLGAFESYKTYYADIATVVAASPAWTSVGNLNLGGNYAPQTSGDQMIFSSVINNFTGTDDGNNDRLQVNGVTVPTNWSWVQGSVPNLTNFDATDNIAQNIVAKVSIPSSGQTISMDVSKLVGTTLTADEISMTAFSVKKKNKYLPTGTFNSAVEKIDGTGAVDVSIDVNDLDFDLSRAKLEYVANGTCTFSPGLDPTLDTNDVNTTADFGDPDIDNGHVYQIGTTTNFIITASGANTVNFDWLSATDAPTADGTYCLRLTANDETIDQVTPATRTLTLDNVAPTAPGALSLNKRTGTSITLNFAASSTETNFKEYKIFYQVYDGTNPTEADSVWASSSDADLGYKNFNNTATTTIGSLSAGTTYSFAIWAYDNYGHKASSSRVDIIANDAPVSSFNSVGTGQKTDGSGTVDVSIEVSDPNNNNSRAKLEYVAGAGCNFASPLDPNLDNNNITSDYGTVLIDNNQEFQIGTSTGWITTPSSNTVTFDWLAKAQIPTANGIYCMRLTTNDSYDTQLVSATTTVTLDNVNPTAAGNLSAGTITTGSIKIIFSGTLATDTNAPATNAYKVFYKKGISGVTEGDTEYDNAIFNSYDYGGAASTTISGLDQNSWYVINIWAYDAYGNKISSTEITAKTLATITNTSLTFSNSLSDGESSNIALAGLGSEWNFQAVVNETNGWYALASATLRLADNSDNSSPFDDLLFSWDQASNAFSEIGNDVMNIATLSNNSTSTCSVNSCTLNFKIIFNKNFTNTSQNYSAELLSANDLGITDDDSYSNIYQVKKIYLEQLHYRWRNDNGGE